MTFIKLLILTLVIATLLGCTAVAVTGAVVGTAAAVAGTAAGTAAKVTGAVVGAAIPDGEKKKKAEDED
ncbi:MAG: hypothetical protein ACO3R5_05690 [Pseudohongiellaceae bacterium]